MAFAMGHIAAMLDFKEPRPIDHCVLPVADLGEARTRYEKLGFTVAPEGIHPFGTKNACVYLADGTFLEPLAQADEKTVYETARRGNVFTARDIAYRYRRSEHGFSAVVFGTEDAEADHAEFFEAGFSAGQMLEFSRDFIDGSGKTDSASFKLAFAADFRAPDCFFFTCQRVNVPNVDRSALQRHENGVLRLKTVVLGAPEVFTFGPLNRLASHAPMKRFEDRWFLLEAANATVEMMNNQEINHRFGVLSNCDRGLQARAIVFGVADVAATKSYLLSSGIEFEKHRGRVFVLPAPGQGAIFAFEAL